MVLQCQESKLYRESGNSNWQFFRGRQGENINGAFGTITSARDARTIQFGNAGDSAAAELG